MENKEFVKNDDLRKVTGGIDTVFIGDTAVCPVCGERPLKVAFGDEYVDTYQCPLCGSQSVHVKKIRPEAPKPHSALVCPQCGTTGEWRIVKTQNGLDTIECRVCRLVRTTPTE